MDCLHRQAGDAGGEHRFVPELELALSQAQPRVAEDHLLKQAALAGEEIGGLILWRFRENIERTPPIAAAVMG